MNTLSLPPLGTFLRPVGIMRWKYTMRVIRHFPPDRYNWNPGIEYERWGIRDGRPYDDGDVTAGHSIDLMPTLLPGVWRYPPALPDEYDGPDSSYRYAQPSYQRWETYFREIGCDERGQMGLI